MSKNVFFNQTTQNDLQLVQNTSLSSKHTHKCNSEHDNENDKTRDNLSCVEDTALGHRSDEGA